MNNSTRLACAGAAVLLSWLSACAAENDSQSAGTCSLSCSQKRAAESDATVISLVTPPPSLAATCGETASGSSFPPTSVPVQVRFKIFRVTGGNTTSGGQTGGTDGGEEATEATTEPIHPEFPSMLDEMPIGGVGFEPVLFGAMDLDKTNADLKDGANVASGKFQGVETPPSEWCSDSCGVMTYEFRPSCVPGGSTVQVGIAVSGAPSPGLTSTLVLPVTSN